jgi:hypothetical protein
MLNVKVRLNHEFLKGEIAVGGFYQLTGREK